MRECQVEAVRGEFIERTMLPRVLQIVRPDDEAFGKPALVNRDRYVANRANTVRADGIFSKLHACAGVGVRPQTIRCKPIFPDAKTSFPDLTALLPPTAIGESRWQRILAPGRCMRPAHRDPLSLVCEIVDIDCELPASGPLRALILAPEHRGGAVAFDPVSLAADMTRVRLAAVVDDLTGEEVRSLAARAAPFAGRYGWKLVVGADGSGVLLTPDTHADVAPSPYDLAGDEIAPDTLGGADSAPLRRFASELELLLFDWPVNAARAARSVAPVNALWFSGAGSVPAARIENAGLPRLFSDDAGLNGFWRLADAQERIENANSWAPAQGSAPAVVDLATADLREAALTLLDDPVQRGRTVVAVPGEGLWRFEKRSILGRLRNVFGAI